MKFKKLLASFAIISFASICVFLTLNRHSRTGCFTYNSEIWGDKAGYYIYLPATFNYNFETAEFPDSIEQKTGNGFRLDYQNNKIITKYTYGVALLQMPFYLIADNLASLLNSDRNGFSIVYHKMIDLASIFYLFLGLIFLWKFHKFKYKNSLISLALLSVFLGSNLYYYSIDETGMSHIYSFSLFCAFLYLIRKTEYLKEQSLLSTSLFGILCGLIIIIRPTNIIFLSSFLFLDSVNRGEVIRRIKRLVKPRTLITIVICLLVVLLPQFLYWKYAYGYAFHYSYGDEGFRWTSPKILQIWFSPNNGLFLYSPFFMLIIISIGIMILRKVNNGFYLLGVFLIITYIFSSWWAYNFGCAFGARSYVEYLSLFSIPVAYIFEKVNTDSNKISKSVFWIIIVALIIFNLKMTYSYDGCFYGSGDWDWKEYFNLVTSPTN
jgi:hypothetical protein